MTARKSLYGQNEASCGVLLSLVVNYKANRKQGVKSNDLHKWTYLCIFAKNNILLVVMAFSYISVVFCLEKTETSSRAVSCCMEVALFVFLYGVMQHKRNVG